MFEKKIVTSALLLGIMGVGVAGPVFAAEGDTQTIEGINGQTSADVITRGNLGAIDATDPETPLPEGDSRWIKVTLPTAVVFESVDQKTISSPKNYEILNESGRPVKVDVSSYEITGGNGVPALTQLNIKRSTGYQGNETVSLVTTQAEVKKYEVNAEFVRLANNKGNFGTVLDGTGSSSTKFEFTGTMNKESLAAKQNFVESKLTFKFTPLRMDGKTIEEAK